MKTQTLPLPFWAQELYLLFATSLQFHDLNLIYTHYRMRVTNTLSNIFKRKEAKANEEERTLTVSRIGIGLGVGRCGRHRM